MPQRLATFCLALWWGSLATIGFIVVPLLFTHLPSPQIAGAMAAKLFSAHTYISLVCGTLLLMLTRAEKWQGVLAWLHAALPWVLFAMLLAALNEFAISPRIVTRENLKLWHALGSGAYLLEWLAVGVVVWRCNART